MWLSRVTLAIPLLGFLYGAPGGPTWAAGDAALAVHLERTAAAPLYGVLASVAAHLPVGEPGYRVGLLDATLAALLVVGVARAGRSLLPKAPLAGWIAALLVAIAPGLHEAAGSSLLAAAGTVWLVASLLDHAREPSRSHAIAALASAAVVIGAAPWLGGALVIVTAALVARTLSSRVLAIGSGLLGLTLVALWFDAVGRLPGVGQGGLRAVVEVGAGAGAVAIGAGLLGTAFAVATRLPHAGRVGWVALVVAVHAVATGRDAIGVLATLAIGAAVIPVAVLRATGSEHRRTVVAVAGIPLVLAAVLAGAQLAPADPGDTPARLASDVIGRLPPGPGVVLATRPATWTAITYAQSIAGSRPDLALAPFPPTDLMAADALRSDRIVGSDVPAFGRIDPTRSFPRGRGFQFLAKPPELVAPVPSPAQYATVTGEVEAILLALARARYEAGTGRLDAAARAAGLVGERGRFRAVDLAMLSTTAPSRTRPAMFGFVPPLDEARPGRWMLELFGDDLAWVAGLEIPVVEHPRERKLHALWRQIWLGTLREDDPAIAALGPAAVEATREMLATLRTPPTPSP